MGQHAQQNSKNGFIKIQKACVRLVYKKKKNTPTAYLFKTAKILTIDDMIKLELLKFGYKLSKEEMPKPIRDIMNKNRGLKKHRYPTRYKKIQNIQAHTSSKYNHSFLCKGVSTLLAANKSIKEAPSYRSMIRTAKADLLSKY